MPLSFCALNLTKLRFAYWYAELVILTTLSVGSNVMHCPNSNLSKGYFKGLPAFDFLRIFNPDSIFIRQI